MIEEFGPRVANVWNHLRTTTRSLVERAWKSSGGGSVMQIPQSTPYDPRADHELSQLLAALDEHTTEAGPPAGDASREARRLADACANVLTQQTQSAEVFAQLIRRAHQRNDYARIDALAEMLSERLAPSEVCELARANNVVVRALAQESLTQMPASLLVALLRDPVDALVARHALERQATEYASEEAYRALRDFEDFSAEEF
jgi:Fic family protein